MTRRANYTITKETADYVVIRDMGPWDEYLSVTNAAATVVSELASTLNGRRLFYYDSDEQLDELLVKDGRFNGFAPGPASLDWGGESEPFESEEDFDRCCRAAMKPSAVGDWP